MDQEIKNQGIPYLHRKEVQGQPGLYETLSQKSNNKTRIRIQFNFYFKSGSSVALEPVLDLAL